MIDYERLEWDDEYAVAEHRKMWRWLAKHPTKDKFNYFEAFGIDYENICNLCFLCHYGGIDGVCCLLKWVDIEGNESAYFQTCTDNDINSWNGLFSTYLTTNCRSLRTKYANMIAELEGVDKEYEGRNKIFKSERY